MNRKKQLFWSVLFVLCVVFVVIFVPKATKKELLLEAEISQPPNYSKMYAVFNELHYELTASWKKPENRPESDDYYYVSEISRSMEFGDVKSPLLGAIFFRSQNKASFDQSYYNFGQSAKFKEMEIHQDGVMKFNYHTSVDDVSFIGSFLEQIPKTIQVYAVRRTETGVSATLETWKVFPSFNSETQ